MRNHIIGGLAVVLAAAAAPTNAEAVATTVNCNKPAETISGKLNVGFDEITVVGTCTETVEIRRDDVTIEGTGNATLIGKVLVDGARRVKIKNLKVQGIPQVTGGILLDRGASVALDHVTVRDAEVGVEATGNSYLEVLNGSVVELNTSTGIFIWQGSSALIVDSTCRNNAGDGLAVQDGGAAQLRDNTFEDNGPGGDSQVFIGENSFARLTGNSITAHAGAEALTVGRGGVARLAGGNTISADGSAAIRIFLGATLIERNGHDIVNGPVQIRHSSNADFPGDADINGDINIDNHSVVNIRDVTVAGSIALARDSGLSLQFPASVSGSVDCDDDESSVSVEDPPNVAGGVNCSGF